MIKKALLLVLGVGLTTSVLFGRNAASYVSTTYHRLTSTVEDAVPVDFQIERAKQMVRDLDPEIRRSMHTAPATARTGLKRFHPRLALLSGFVPVTQPAGIRRSGAASLIPTMRKPCSSRMRPMPDRR